MKLLNLAMLTFVFLVTSALSINRRIELKKTEELRISKLTETFTPLPVLKQGVRFPIVSAQAAMAVDIKSGVPLYEKDPDASLLPASTTKIVTALVTMDNYSEDEVLKVINPKVDGRKMGLVKGEQISVKNLLYGLLVFSANDAAEVLAQNFPGGRESFILAMNEKAKELHLVNTKFANPSGLDGDGHISTARDLVRVAEVAMTVPRFVEIVGTKEKTVASTDGNYEHKLLSTNELLGSVEGVMGIKTGWTESARENLVTYITRDEHTILITLMGSQDRFGETEELIDWIFAGYEWREVNYETYDYSP